MEAGPSAKPMEWLFKKGRGTVPATSSLGPHFKMDVSLHHGKRVQWHSLARVLPAFQEAYAQSLTCTGPEQGAVQTMLPARG